VPFETILNRGRNPFVGMTWNANGFKNVCVEGVWVCVCVWGGGERESRDDVWMFVDFHYEKSDVFRWMEFLPFKNFTHRNHFIRGPVDHLEQLEDKSRWHSRGIVVFGGRVGPLVVCGRNPHVYRRIVVL
jgi:hypothetical protein